MHDPHAEPRIPPLLGEQTVLRHAHAVLARAQLLRDRLRRQRAGNGRAAEAQPGHVVQARLRIAHHVPDARQPLDGAGDEVQRQRDEQQREPPAVEQVVQLEPAVGPEHQRPVRERALDVREGVVLRVHERAGDHCQEEQQQIREGEPQRAKEAEHLLDGRVRLLGRELRDLADRAGERTGLDQRLAHRFSRNRAASQVRGASACAPGCLFARSAVQ